MRLRVPMAVALTVLPEVARVFCFASTISSICLKNQRSILVSVKHLLHVPALREGLAEEEDALGIRHGELGGERLVIDFLVGTIADEAEAFDLQAAQGLLQRSP